MSLHLAKEQPRPPGPAIVPSLGDVFRDHATQVGRWAARLGGPGVDVDDIVQEVFLIVSRQLAGFRAEAKLTTWLFSITDRVVRNHRRWLAVRRIVVHLTPGHSEHPATDQPDPLAMFERQASAVAAYRVLDRLPDKYRRVLILSELEDLCAPEIAELLSTRLETVRVWLHRARRMLIERVRELERAEEERLFK